MLPGLIVSLSLVLLVTSVYLAFRSWLGYKKILDHAHHQSQHIVAKAQEEALQIISAANVSASDNKRNVDERADKLAREQLRKFEENLRTISEGLKQATVKEAGEFRKALELETTKGQKMVGESLANQFDKVAVEIDEYKKNKMKEVDAQIHEIIGEVFVKIAGKLIPVDQQQKLVISALEQAKKDHVF